MSTPAEIYEGCRELQIHGFRPGTKPADLVGKGINFYPQDGRVVNGVIKSVSADVEGIFFGVQPPEGKEVTICWSHLRESQGCPEFDRWALTSNHLLYAFGRVQIPGEFDSFHSDGR